jgi:hypothetical protein
MVPDRINLANTLVELVSPVDKELNRHLSATKRYYSFKLINILSRKFLITTECR